MVLLESLSLRRREDMSAGRRKRDIPDRWEDYTAVGRRLRGTRFIAFKVPLKQALTRMLPRSEAFGPWQLLDALERDDQELGLIVDLTFTKRYYALRDVPQSLFYVKICTAGHEVPSDATILSFKRAVRRFLRDNEDNDKLIGVHCTHGLNRTGYLICRYLIDVDGMEPAEAVQLFNSSRGHAIERQNYLEDLHHGPNRSNQGMEETEEEPQRGLAAHRPDTAPPDGRADTRLGLGLGDPSYYRSYPQRRPSHRSHPYPPQHAHLPRPPLLAHPPLAFLQPYRWTPPPPGGQWRSPPGAGQDRAGAPPPLLPCYSHWTSVANGDGSEDWVGPGRYSQRHRANGCDEY